MVRISRLLVAGGAVCAVVALAGGLTGCSQISSMMNTASSSKSLSTGEVDGSANTAAQGINGSVTVTSTWMTLTASNPIDAADEAEAIATQAGGYVESRSEGTDDGGVVPLTTAKSSSPAGSDVTSVSLTLRVPTNTMDATIAAVQKLGHQTSFNQTRYDATRDKLSLDAQIQSLQDSLAALRTLQAQATNVTDLLAAEDAISSRQADLDSLVTQRDYLMQQVDLTAIAITFDAPSVSPATGLTFVDGIVNGWKAIMTAGSLLAVAVGFLLPWLAILVVLAAVVLAITVPLVRRSKRHRAEAEANAKKAPARR